MDGLKISGLGVELEIHIFTVLQFYSLGTINRWSIAGDSIRNIFTKFTSTFLSSNGLSRFLDKNCIISQIGNHSVKATIYKYKTTILSLQNNLF